MGLGSGKLRGFYIWYSRSTTRLTGSRGGSFCRVICPVGKRFSYRLGGKTDIRNSNAGRSILVRGVSHCLLGSREKATGTLNYDSGFWYKRCVRLRGDIGLHSQRLNKPDSRLVGCLLTHLIPPMARKQSRFSGVQVLVASWGASGLWCSTPVPIQQSDVRT